MSETISLIWLLEVGFKLNINYVGYFSFAARARTGKWGESAESINATDNVSYREFGFQQHIILMGSNEDTVCLCYDSG